MQLNPYLTFKGQCEAAFKFYEKVLGGKIEAMIPHEGTPAAETSRPNGATRSCTPAWSWATRS
jgi:PhnB protein